MNNILYKIKSILNKVTPNERAEHFKSIGLLSAGYGCELYPKVQLGSEPYLIKLGNNVRVTSGVRFITHDGGMWVLRNLEIAPNSDKMGTIQIGNNVFIGQHSCIMPGVNIGSNIVIGTGSIVTKDIPDNVVVAGVPAKIISSINDYYTKNIEKIDYTKNMSYKDKKKYYIEKFNF